MKYLKSVFGTILLITLLFCGNNTFAGELRWYNSRSAAFAKAKSENKKVLLFGGRGSCGNCRYMRTQVFETAKPPVKTLLEKHFVIWFSNVDKSTEWRPYARGLRYIDLPLICVIDPAGKKIYEYRSTGRQHNPDFYARLLKHTQK